MVEGRFDRQACFDARWHVSRNPAGPPSAPTAVLTNRASPPLSSPHDTYAMTSRSVRGYTTGIYRKLGLKEEEIRKVQTGGPDGDLGSSEFAREKLVRKR